MHTLFEVYLTPGSLDALLTEETKRDTLAQVMTREQAQQIGFQGMPEPPAGVEQGFIVVSKTDERRILNVLEASPNVAQFRTHDVDM